MTTEQVAARLVELFNQGKAVQAEEELYADNVVSKEQDASRSAQGKEAIMAKTKQAFEYMMANNEEVSAKAAQTFINQDTFLIVFEMMMKPKGGEAVNVIEYGFYRVVDGKVVEEYFYM